MKKPPLPQTGDFERVARECGFELAGVAPARPLTEFAFYSEWVAAGLAGPMGYLTDHRAALREDPRSLLPSARSVLCVGKLYKTRDIEPEPGQGRISRYAWGAEDYHDVLRRALERMVDRLRELWGEFDARICVDTAPLLERALARAAGLGWIGKNTCLINQPLGSWFFLGEVLVSVDLAPGAPPPDRCGTCRRCIDVCPTQAIVPTPAGAGPQWQVDGRLCISTLTIEQKTAVNTELRPGVGAHLFGCDLCQEVCPWNRRAPATDEPAFQPVHAAPDLEELAAMTPEQFRARFRRTPLWRSKYQGLLKNLALVMGNSGDPRHCEALRRMAETGDETVKDHAEWALSRLESGR